ncbi:MAG TPA: hypothetical protein VMK12_09205 [Anaeromyxobacteraceae bacterium]|nr:hypothetical protein [Anaeromyxobacteraceae bacterium]
MTLGSGAIYLVLSLVAGILGRNRRIGFWGFLFCSILFTPLVSLLFLFFSAPRARISVPRKV